jgi:hypothetical protein
LVATASACAMSSHAMAVRHLKQLCRERLKELPNRRQVAAPTANFFRVPPH